MLHKKKFAGPAVAVLALAAAFVAPQGRTAPLEVYGKLPSVEDVALSPDGSRLAMIRPVADDRMLVVISVSEHKVLGKGLRIGSTKLRSLEWADDDHLMIVTSETALPMGLIGRRHEWYLLHVWDVDKQKMSSYPDPDKTEDVRIMNALYDDVMVRRLDGHTILFVPGIYLADETLPALFRVDLATGRQRLMRQGSEQTQEWLVDEKGEIAAEEDYDQKQQRWRMLERRDGRLQEIASGHEPIDIPELLGFGPQPGTLLVQTHEDGGAVWRLLSLQDGSFGPSMAERDSLGAPIEDRLTHRMIGGVHLDDSRHYVFFDPRIRAVWSSIVDGFSDEQLEFVSASADFAKVVVKVNGPIHGYMYVLMDMSTHRGTPIGEVYSGVGVPLETKPLTYPAADGLQIPAYLTFPRGKPPKNLPLIVFPHGGPAARDSAEFGWWAQAMAAQGYLVLQPNYRGSIVTEKLLEAGFGEWGRKMQTDLSDGVRYLVKEGTVDPARVCIVGASYGGYAALAGVTLDPGVYRCAVSVAGISDLKRMLQGVDEYNTASSLRFWNRYMGVTGPSDPLLQQFSPIKHVDAIKVPVLLIHGRDDSVVSFDQSTAMLDAMKHAKKEVEMVVLKNEDHWLSRSETRLQMLQSSVAFLRAHNPPD
ncbi:MAG: prolyl oligopeptidase family protein [Gammaproteobacteria bacterium]|nr:prolyl oligopeptidase family protein [Gammaproteobacteria bacterium]